MGKKRNTKDFSRGDLISFIPNNDIYIIDEAPYLWNVDSVVIGDKTTISGWCLPHGGRLNNTTIVINDYSFNPIRTSPQGHFAELYPWHPNAALSAFTVQIERDQLDIPALSEISISCLSKTGPRNGRGYTLDLLIEDLDFVMPPPEIAARIGATNLLHYVMFGRAIFRGFERALKKNFGTSYSDYSTIIDFGCGSGRIARHVENVLEHGSTLVGFDIDAIAVEWANRHIGPHFRSSTLNPPLDLGAASVDLVYAYSVFTHLAAENMTSWLKEMERILKPGGVGLFTVLSDRAMIALQPGMPRPTLEAWKSTGIYDSIRNAQLDTIEIPNEYYRNVWLTQSYIKRIFGSSFKIVDFVGSFHFYQDLVVVRRI